MLYKCPNGHIIESGEECFITDRKCCKLWGIEDMEKIDEVKPKI
jgi:hypothetical protein